MLFRRRRRRQRWQRDARRPQRNPGQNMDFTYGTWLADIAAAAAAAAASQRNATPAGRGPAEARQLDGNFCGTRCVRTDG